MCWPERYWDGWEWPRNGGIETDHVDVILRRAETAEGDAIQQRALAVRAIGLPLPFGRGVRANETGSNVVDSDPPRSELVGELASEAEVNALWAKPIP